jgi:GAF domain-containing protein
MTARTASLRIRIGSEESKILKGDGAIEDKGIGLEFSVFPLIHAEKVLGTLNITGYPRYALGDPSQMVLFLSVIERILPRLAESSYREDLSPNIDEQSTILAIETKFASSILKTKAILTKCLDEIAKALDCKIIISRAIPAEDRLLTFTNHNYSEEDTKFLDNHSPRLKDSLVTSPANVAISRRTVVYVNDIQRMFSIYPQFLVFLFKRNETQSLLVAPVFHKHLGDIPWGVIWIEFSNRLNRPESDLRDLADFACLSIQRQILAYFEHETQQKLTHDLSALVPRHVVEKMRQGIDPREAEVGYLLNIDLAGSTRLAKHLGEVEFSKFIQQLSDLFIISLSDFSFTQQVIIWDAFIFTRTGDCPIVSKSEATFLLSEIDRIIRQANEVLPPGVQIQFRAILHHGDTTRDWTVGSARTWTVTGSALAESCKLESEIKDRVRVLLVSGACPAFQDVEGDPEKRLSANLLTLAA